MESPMANDGDGPESGDRPGGRPVSDKLAGGERPGLLPSPHGPLHLPKDDPDAPPSEEERRGAAALREALSATEEPASYPKGSGPAPRLRERSEEARWLAAHLRLPSSNDSLGEVRARGISRAAREAVLSRRAGVKRRDSGWRQLGRALSGTGGLLAAAAVLLVVSWGLLDQGLRLRQGLLRPMPRATTALLLRGSLQRNESPTQRLDLMMQERLQQLRAAPVRSGGTVLASRVYPSSLLWAALPARPGEAGR
jgi:hypothetical protein